jgi:hypothetical protein
MGALRLQPFLEIIEHLGYPAYFITILGVWIYSLGSRCWRRAFRVSRNGPMPASSSTIAARWLRVLGWVMALELSSAPSS